MVMGARIENMTAGGVGYAHQGIVGCGIVLITKGVLISLGVSLIARAFIPKR